MTKAEKMAELEREEAYENDTEIYMCEESLRPSNICRETYNYS